MQVTKTGDRAAAEPGDTVIYHVAVRNLDDALLSHLRVVDTLPTGFQIRADSVRADVGGVRVPIALKRDVASASTIVFHRARCGLVGRADSAARLCRFDHAGRFAWHGPECPPAPRAR